MNNEIDFDLAVRNAHREQAVVMGAAILSLLKMIGNALGAVFGSIASAIEFKRAFNELDALTDTQLRDIGVNRGEIAHLIMNRHTLAE